MVPAVCVNAALIPSTYHLWRLFSWPIQYVVVFFTLTDRASTIPSNIRGSNPVRGLLDRERSEEHLPSSNESKRKTLTHKKRQRERNRNNKIHRTEKDRRGAFDRESLA